MSISSSLISLNNQRNNLATNLTSMGVQSSNTETLSQLVPKVLNIPSNNIMKYTDSITHNNDAYQFNINMVMSNYEITG